MTELLFYGGLLISGLSVLGAVAVVIILRLRRRRLIAMLEAEYGKPAK